MQVTEEGRLILRITKVLDKGLANTNKVFEAHHFGKKTFCIALSEVTVLFVFFSCA